MPLATLAVTKQPLVQIQVNPSLPTFGTIEATRRASLEEETALLGVSVTDD